MKLATLLTEAHNLAARIGTTDVDVKVRADKTIPEGESDLSESDQMIVPGTYLEVADERSFLYENGFAVIVADDVSLED